MTDILRNKLKEIARAIANILLNEKKAYKPQERGEDTIYLLTRKDKTYILVPAQIAQKHFKNFAEYKEANTILKAAGVLVKTRTMRILPQKIKKKPKTTSEDWKDKNIKFIRFWYYDYVTLTEFLEEYIDDPETKRAVSTVLLDLFKYATASSHDELVLG